MNEYLPGAGRMYIVYYILLPVVLEQCYVQSNR